MSDAALTDVERLHEELFGTVPAKHGTAYERIAAVVLAVLGWKDVQHDRVERPVGRRASHQLDVCCRRDDGTVERLIVECKDIGRGAKVGQGILSKLAHVRDTVGATHAAVLTTSAFTRGARDLAVDEDIALVRLRPYVPELDDGTWIKAVKVTMRIGFPMREDLEVLRVDGNWESADHLGAWIEDCCEVRGADVPTTVGELLAGAETVSAMDGRQSRRLVLADPVEIETRSGWVAILGMRWADVTAWAVERFTTAAKGEPRLVLQQLDDAGEPHDGKVLVTSKLEAWTIDEASRRVVRRGGSAAAGQRTATTMRLPGGLNQE